MDARRKGSRRWIWHVPRAHPTRRLFILRSQPPSLRDVRARKQLTIHGKYTYREIATSTSIRPYKTQLRPIHVHVRLVLILVPIPLPLRRPPPIGHRRMHVEQLHRPIRPHPLPHPHIVLHARSHPEEPPLGLGPRQRAAVIVRVLWLGGHIEVAVGADGHALLGLLRGGAAVDRSGDGLLGVV